MVDGAYKLEGLSALSTFFAKETRDNIQSRPLTELDARPDYVSDEAGDSEGCYYDAWEKGFHLALLQFGELNSAHSIFKTLLAEFGTNLDDDFTERYRKAARKKFRDRIHHLSCYAKAWDLFYVPLRFFTDEAARDFMEDRHGYTANDLGNFRSLFRKGGSSKKGRGLAGLHPHQPAIIQGWEACAGRISLSRNAAARHGLDLDSAVPALEQFSDMAVRVMR